MLRQVFFSVVIRTFCSAGSDRQPTALWLEHLDRL
jgi:hypothetical protein